ncbi:MAG: hypothetical protein GKR90_20600 [Pseudomonadales bacterium]|nr:hypothetical protein [Pseudomonadales bacterium]
MTREQNQVALLLGSGPSLARLDLSADTSSVATFGMNAGYRFWEKIGWWPTYYSCLDEVVGISHQGAIGALLRDRALNGIERFLLRRNLCSLLGSETLEYVDCYEDLVEERKIAHLNDITTGSHTLLWAHYLGYRTILLSGIDLNYVEQVEGSRLVDGKLEIVEQKENSNYFFEGYQQPGDVYNIPNPRDNLHLESWHNVAKHIRDFTLVVNLNPDSALHTFLKNNSDNPMQIGNLVSLTRTPFAELDVLLTRLNAKSLDLDTARGVVKSRLAQNSNKWMNSTMNPDSDGKALVYSNGVFALSSDELTGEDVLLVRSLDSRLLRPLLEELVDFGVPKFVQKLRRFTKLSSHKLFVLLPGRLRRVSVRENIQDLLIYYGTLRGMVVLFLSGILSAMIWDPKTDLLHFLFGFLSFSIWAVLLGRTHR